MKILYTCETCGKTYETETAASECEIKHREEEARLRALKSQKEDRRKELFRLRDEYETKRKDYILDYGERFEPMAEVASFESPLKDLLSLLSL